MPGELPQAVDLPSLVLIDIAGSTASTYNRIPRLLAMLDPREAEGDGSGILSRAEAPDLPQTTSEHSPATSDQVFDVSLHPEVISQEAVKIVVPPVQKRWEYPVYHETPFISKVLKEYDNSDGVQFLVRLSDGSDSKVSSNRKFWSEPERGVKIPS